MHWLILLFSLGIFLIALEVILPGGIIGSIGALFIFGGCILSFITLGTIPGLIATALALLLTVLVIYVEFKILPNTKLGRKFFLKSEITAISSNLSQQTHELIGKTAEAITLLSPSGYVRVDGKQYEASSQSGQIRPGTTLEITGANQFHLIVKQKA